MFSSDSEYDVEFKTAAEENAGTDANVYFQMIGEEGESQEIELKNKGKGYFNRGQLDRFRIRADDVGRVSEYCEICGAHVTLSIRLSGFLFINLSPAPHPLARRVRCFASVLSLLQNAINILTLTVIFVSFFSPFFTSS